MRWDDCTGGRDHIDGAGEREHAEVARGVGPEPARRGRDVGVCRRRVGSRYELWSARARR